jgi:hypothetical protein
LQDAVAEAIARAAIRQVRSEKLTAAAALLYEKTQRAPMFNFSVYALARIADSALLSAHQSVIFSACRAPHPENAYICYYCCIVFTKFSSALPAY